ncbi:universal stress protein [Streptomyces sp. ITFR-16]|uniref:universal stress protein n=1 Tax=Streptomyces sp. ITFR-16 TaxID=3075198 RepID=UPI0028894607|nr:universal stress protein [Streptomyces sp. ITFR-16]WNI26140.1 universal stress protein [Streptomyces sp. ITFR-16]
MSSTMDDQDVVVGIDPVKDWHLPLAWATDEAHRRGLGLRLVLVVPPQHDAQHVDDAPRHMASERAGAEVLAAAVAWAHARWPDVAATTLLLGGRPGPTLAHLSRRARMLVLGSRHLSRAEEFLSAGSLAVPVTAQASCPVVVVADAEHSTQQPSYLVVGVDGSEAAQGALALAFEEADLRGCALRVVAVWQPPVFSWRRRDPDLDDERRLLSETVAGWAGKYPDVPLRHEVVAGPPVEVLADAAEHALAVVVGRRGQGGYSGMRLGSVVHGLLHRAHCPVITVPMR